MNADWKGFIFPMGFFIVWKYGRVAYGKRDPITKEILSFVEILDEL